MRKLQQIGQLLLLLVQLPFKISNGQKKHTYKKIKQLMISANLL